MDFNLLIERARYAINSSLQKILNLFPDNHLFSMNEDERGKELLVEARLDEATLNCILYENEPCKLSYLFLDDSTNIQDYIRYCNDNYPYNEEKKSWELPNCFLKVEEEKEDSVFIFEAV